MATFGSPFPHFEPEELKLEEDTTDLTLEVKPELIEIKQENWDAYSADDVQSSNVEGNRLSQNFNTTGFDVNIEEDFKKSDVPTNLETRLAQLKKPNGIHIPREYCTKDQTENTPQVKTNSCLYCEFEAPYKATFESHMVRKHPEKCDPSQLKIHSCLHCEFKTSYKITFESHMVRKHPEKCDPSQLKTHSCLHCEFKTRYKKTLELHIVGKHPEMCDPSQLKSYSCLHCNLKTPSKMSLKLHMARKHPEKCESKPYSCLHCEFKTPYKITFESHMERKHPEKCGPSQLKTHSCLHCGFKTHYKKTLELHMVCKHPERCESSQIKTHSCSYCEFKTPHKMTLESHMVRIHPEKCNPSELEQKVCHFCGKMYSLFFSLQRHMQIEHLNEKIRCSLCDFTCVRNKELVFHMKRFHKQEKVFQCHDCGFTSSKKLILREHILGKHLNLKEHTCDICSFKTLYMGTLITHKQAHNCPERLTCKYCPFITLNIKALDKHNRVQHNSNRSFKCDQCGYTTSKKYLFLRHVDSQHKKMEYICQVCGKYGFKYKHNLLTHMYKMHGKQPVRASKKLVGQENPNGDIPSVKVEENEDQRPKDVNMNNRKEQIKQEIKIETIYIPSLLDYQEDTLPE